MKIIHLNTWDYGGAAEAAKRIFRSQKVLKKDVKFLSLYPKKNQKIPGINYYSDYLNKRYFNGSKIILLLNRIMNQFRVGLSKKIFFNSPKTLFRVENINLVQDADVIHLHSVVKFLNIPTFFNSIEKPIIWTLHDMNPFSGGKHYECDFDSTFSKKEDAFKLIKKSAYFNKKNIYIVCPSKWMYDLSKNSELLGSFKHFLIPNGIDTSRFYFKNTKKSTDTLNLLFVAESLMDERKGFHLFQRALSMVNIPITLTIIGNTNENFHFPKNVSTRYLGYIKEAATMVEQYNQADYFVMPSIEDNLPNTIVESLCCGTPVIAFNCTGMANMIDDKVNGLLINEISAENLAQGILLSNLLKLSNSFNSGNISNAAKKEYDLQKCEEAYQQVYNQAISASI